MSVIYIFAWDLDAVCILGVSRLMMWLTARQLILREIKKYQFFYKEMYWCISLPIEWSSTVSTFPFKILLQYYWQMQCNCPPPPPIFFHPVCICGWDNNPKSLCAFKLLKISKQNTVWQNIDSEVFLIFIEYTEPAAINKSKRLIKYLKTLNRTTKKRGLL